uniref:SnoaL-like domain-containing protein n=1 Tax=Mycena chlorophos TaxID=658473 RepID=A0ABQ0M134_MYCCL|nr:predicted protein [Mycena chlorophos]
MWHHPRKCCNRHSCVSPIVIPASTVQRTGEWADDIVEAKQLVAELTVEENFEQSNDWHRYQGTFCQQYWHYASSQLDGPVPERFPSRHSFLQRRFRLVAAHDGGRGVNVAQTTFSGRGTRNTKATCTLSKLGKDKTVHLTCLTYLNGRLVRVQENHYQLIRARRPAE